MTSTGIGNLAVNLAGSGSIGNDLLHPSVGSVTVNAIGLNAHLINDGVFNTVANLSANNTTITNNHTGKGAIGSLAFNALGSGNTVQTSGVASIAGSIAQTGQTVTQDGPGFNINGHGIGAASARRGAATPAAARASKNA